MTIAFDPLATNRMQSCLRPFVCVLAVGLVLAYGVATGIRYLSANEHFLDRRLYAENATTLAYLELAEALSGFAADLRVLAKNPDIRRLSADNAHVRAAAEQALLDFAEEKRLVSQVRVIDPAGWEAIRIERHGQSVEVIGPAGLQDKSNRYYFHESIDLPAQGLYVSALDLNVENGVVQVPWEPTLRIAEPIAGPDGKTIGVLILNILADGFANSINSKRPGADGSIQLLNAEGYWLAGVADDKLWGFQTGQGTTMAAENGDAWTEILRVRNGNFQRGGIYYVFRSLDPAQVLSDLPRVTEVRSDDPFWVVLGQTEKPGIWDLWCSEDLPLLIAAIGTITLLAGLVAFLWRARQDAEADRLTVEAELVRAERMAGLGNLVAGIAHELNTPIGNAVTVASTLSDRVNALREMVTSGQVRRSSLDACLKDLIEGTGIMQRGLGHAAELIQNFKQVAVDQTTAQRRRFRLSELIGEVAGMMQPRFKHQQVILETVVLEDGELDSYPGPLLQVLMNLAENSLVHGFDEGQTGHVTISARQSGDDEVEIVVSDTGKGISAAHQPRVFEPFFTTKLGSGGTGLGLSICFRIVSETLGGTINVASQPGEGTRMTIDLPLVAPGRLDT